MHSIDSQCFTIANSVLIDHLRKLASEKKHLGVLEQREAYNMLSVCFSANEFESSDFLKVAVTNLPPVRKTIFTLKIAKGYSNKEIADQLSISVKTVEDHYTKAIKYIRSATLAIQAGLFIFCTIQY